MHWPNYVGRRRVWVFQMGWQSRGSKTRYDGRVKWVYRAGKGNGINADGFCFVGIYIMHVCFSGVQDLTVFGCYITGFVFDLQICVAFDEIWYFEMVFVMLGW